MAHAQPADRPFPNVAVRPVPAALVAAILAAVVAVAALGPIGPFRLDVGPEVNPLVLEAGRQWEIQRKQQSGWVDPVIESGREWERQRKQQSGLDV